MPGNPRIDAFVQNLAAHFGARLECVVLTGSHARDEATAGSDIDLWVMLDEIRTEDLHEIGVLVTRSGDGHLINPQCTSFAELRSGAFREQFSPVQLHLDGIVLHGGLELPAPTPEEVRRQAGSLAALSLMSARHYISVQEPEENLAHGKLQKWVLKPLLWSLRYEAFVRTGIYPRTMRQLRGSGLAEEAVDLVRAYEALLENRFTGPWMETVEKAASWAQRNLSSSEASHV